MATVFSREAQRSLDRAEGGLFFVLRTGEPIFFSGGERQAKQVCKSGDSAAAHFDAEEGAVNKAHRLLVHMEEAVCDLLRHAAGT